MELLVATLAYIVTGTDTDVLTHIRQIGDSVRNASGLVAFHIYRGREQDNYYFLLTTWADLASWQKAQECSDPRQHLLTSGHLLLFPPEQWLMHYQWGYSRPAKQGSVFAIHIATLRPDQVRLAQQTWITGLREQVLKPILAFSFLAQEIDREATIPFRAIKPLPIEKQAEDLFLPSQSTTLLNFLSWASETERDAFYRDASYLSMKKQYANGGTIRILPLEIVP